jgi:hypothetical protein
METTGKTEMVNREKNKDKKENRLNEYIQSLDTRQRMAYEIAKEHLGSSFDLYRSNGFQEWMKKK